MRYGFIIILVIAFILSIFFVESVFSQTIDIEGNIDWELRYYERVVITTDCNESLTYIIPEDALNISIDDTNRTDLNIFGCNGNLSLNYSLDIVKQEDLQYRLERKFNVPQNTQIKYIVKMPFNFKVNKNQTFPENYTIFISENENYKIINFSSSNNDFYLIYLEEIHISSLTDTINEWKVVFLSIFFFILGFLSSYSIHKFRKKETIENNSIPSYVLLQVERDIIQVIKENPGINQKQIGKRLNLSKAKVSYVISDLEQKKLVKREKFGRSFKVYLNKEIE